jgi:hypothetical protein
MHFVHKQCTALPGGIFSRYNNLIFTVLEAVMGPRHFSQDQDQDQDTKPQDQDQDRGSNPQDRGQDRGTFCKTEAKTKTVVQNFCAKFVSPCPIYLCNNSTQLKTTIQSWL